ncbi:pca operon transcription factor PcaQ [Ferrovibrio sp.]|uniref:pca operon transcription factor PcaQ n=1 Tax=Ferrovibrio sp. TaxID=1917215 RepID=UPI0035B3EDA4
MLDSRIKLRHLSCFLEVSAQRSFGQAAGRLGLSQPAVSKAIAELEEILGGSLLQRSRAGVFLTPAGEAFRRYAETGMAALREGFASIGQTARGEGGFLAIGALPTVATRLVPAALLHAKRPGQGGQKNQGLDATIRVLTGPNDYLLGLLNGGQLDIVVGRLSEPKLMQGLSFEPLYTDEIVFVVRPQHPLIQALARSGARSLTLRDIAAYTVLFPMPGAIIRPDVERLMLGQGVTGFADVIETVSPSFGRRYTRISDAVWIISRGVVADDLEQAMLAALPLRIDRPTGAVGMTTRADRPASPALNRLRDALRHMAEDLR